MLHGIETLIIRPKEEHKNGRLTYLGYVVVDPVSGRIVLQNGEHISNNNEHNKEEQERLKRHLLKETLKSLPKTNKVVLSGIPVKYLLP